MKSKHFTLPNTENRFLSDVLESIRKRSKSIKHNTWEFEVERVFEQYEDEKVEKIEIKVKPSNYNAFATIEVWEDRWILVSTFERTKEKKWDWTREGKYLPTYTGKELVAALQSTVAAFFQMGASKVQKFDQIWQPLLAKKPELIK